MGISRRIATLFRAKANKVLDHAEDPREVLDYSYERQLETVQKVRRGLADVATSRKRIELQITQLELLAGKLQGQAQQALAAGRYRILQNQRGLLLAAVLRASTDVVICAIPYRLTTRWSD
jgi:phage shock protein A